MKVSSVKPVVQTQVVRRLPQPYVGEDPAVFIHKNKTHRSTAEAFRDAEYAQAIYKHESEWQALGDYLGWLALWGVFFAVLYFMAKVFP